MDSSSSAESALDWLYRGDVPSLRTPDLRTSGFRTSGLVLAAGLAVLTGCGSPSAEDIASALVADGADESAARCVADEVVRSDLSTDSVDRLAEEGLTDDNGEPVQFLEDDSAILQAVVTACLG